MAATNPNDPCAKGPVTCCLDDISIGDGARVRLDALRNAVIALKDKDYRGLEKVFARKLLNHRYDKDQIKKITDYLKTCWFDQKSGWWPSFQPIAPIYAEGLLRAMKPERKCASLSKGFRKPPRRENLRRREPS